MNNVSATDWEQIWNRHTGRANEKVKTVPKLIKKIKQRQIGYIDLSRLNIKTVPEWVKSLPGIRELDLSNTKITKLPEWIGSLTQLEVLDLSNTKITKLPPSVGNLKNLLPNCN
jgi:Leucine-rich repeat (LRR) protein